jgi:hypothetical protein
MTNYNHDAIRKAYPNAITIEDGFGVKDADGNPITFDQALVDAAAAEIQSELDATQYQRNRQPEYPSLATLADALYWSNQGDNTKLDEYYAACAAVKAKYPKPEVN